MSYTPSPSPPATPPTSNGECEGVTCLKNSQLSSGSYLASTPPHPHPFAASARANRPPPDYEKKPFTPPTTLLDPKTKSYPCGEQTRSNVEAEVASPISSIQGLPLLADEERKRWDFAISSAVDKAQTKLDLSNAGLTYIPSSIIDLKDLVVLARSQRATINTTRTFTRSITTPAILPSSHIRPFLPSHSTNRLEFKATGKRLQDARKPTADRHGCYMELYLMRNAIHMLPRELFALDCLVVLSLRQNKLTSLPPAICKLTRLRELNIANNSLSHLPAEIQDLRLDSFHLYPNPFITPPSPGDEQIHRKKLTRTLGPLQRGPSIPTLVELSLRSLLSPANPTSLIISSRSQSCLEASMTLAEIDALLLPVHIKKIVRASTGHGRARLTEEGASVDAEHDVTQNVCPCPRHDSLVRSNIGAKKSVRFVPNGHQNKRNLFDHNAPVFRVPVEERMEWVGTVGGVEVAESPNAWVPLLWRGCGPGCLDFLEDEEDPGMSDECKDTFEAGNCDKEDEFQFSDDE